MDEATGTMKMSAAQAHGLGSYLRREGKRLEDSGYIGEISLVRHGGDLDFVIEIRLENDQGEEYTVAHIDQMGEVEVVD
jgi:hypothetical protein